MDRDLLWAAIALVLVFEGSAGALGSGQGRARVRLEPRDGQTRLRWWVQVQLSGRLAQFGNRLVEATARKLSEEFFRRLAGTLGGREATGSGSAPTPASWLGRLLHALFSFLRK